MTNETPPTDMEHTSFGVVSDSPGLRAAVKSIDAMHDTPGARLAFSQYGVTHSTELGKLAEALCKAQGDIKNPSFDSFNSHYKSKYASLAATLDCVRTACAKHSLSFVQPACCNGERYGCQTILMHSSGQWMRSELLLRPEKQDVHGAGAALTYARRYSIQSMFGISADEDDDGNAAATPEKTDAAPQRTVPEADEQITSKQACVKAFQEWTGALPEDLPGLIQHTFKTLNMRLGASGKFSESQWKKLLKVANDAIQADVIYADAYPPE